MLQVEDIKKWQFKMVSHESMQDAHYSTYVYKSVFYTVYFISCCPFDKCGKPKLRDRESYYEIHGKTFRTVEELCDYINSIFKV